MSNSILDDRQPYNLSFTFFSLVNLKYVFTGATVAIIAERLSRCTACVVSYGAVLTEATAAGAASVDCWRLVREQT